MPRFAPLEPPYSAEIQQSFDKVMPPGVPPLMLFRTMATSERAWSKFREGSMVDRGPLSLREREIVINRTCSLAKCEYEWGVHVNFFAQRVKFSSEQVRATVLEGPDALCWLPAEQALIAAVDALHYRAKWTEEEFTRLASHFDTSKIFEIVLLCGRYRTVAYLANVLDLPPEPDAARFPSV